MKSIESPEIFLTRLCLDLAHKAKAYVRPRIKSKVLSKSLRSGKGKFSKFRHFGFVEIPHYWAVYYHDGRGPIRAKPGKYLVYFNWYLAQLDPRVKVGSWYPKRANQVRHLTKAQFYEHLRKGNIIVTKRVGPAEGQHFFTKGMAGFAQQADRIVRQEVRAWVDTVVDLGSRAERRGTAKGSISL